MFFKIAISLILIITVFASAILFASQPYGGPQKVVRVLWAVWLNARAHTHNFLSVVRLIIRKKRLKPVYRRYPKTTDFVIGLFILLVTIIVIVTITLVAGLFSE